jgi:DNA-binding transcriptional ArsR family regulator
MLAVTTPLYQLKAEFFKTLSHPARIRVLELLSGAEMSVTELQREIGIESSHLSQQLAVLRRAGLVTIRKQGTTVYYSLAAADVAELLAVARRILTDVISDQIGILRDLKRPVPARNS